MIDNLSLLVSHGLLLIACWRLLFRDDLDVEEVPAPDMGNGEGDTGDA